MGLLHIMEKDRLEEAFRFIGEGNELDGKGEHWQAAQLFANVMKSLFQLASEIKPKNKEEEKIEELYQAQCRGYLHRARKSLVDALSKEDATDQSEKNADPKFITMSEQEASNRVQLFSMLFSKDLDIKAEGGEVKDVDHQQSSIEDRLRSLNASLPPALKSDTERMKEINRSLKGLGVNVYSHTDHKQDIVTPISKEDEIANIIAQAKDEARFETSKENGMVSSDDEIVSSDEEENLSDESDDETLSDESYQEKPRLRNKKVIRNVLVNAQVKLARLLAMFNSGAKHSETSNKELENSDKMGAEEEEDGICDDNIKQVDFEPEQGRKLLLKARKDMDKALAAWKVEP